jgi:hypothetical protein
MTNAAGLVRATANALMINEASLSVQMRFLREAELMPTGGRGTGGYIMRPQDAATLITAAAVTSALKDTAELTKKFLELPLSAWDVFGPDRRQQHPEPPLPGLNHEAVIRKFGFGRISRESNFRTTFAFIVEQLVKGNMFPELTGDDFAAQPDDKISLAYRHSLSVNFYLPVPAISVAYIAYGIFREALTFSNAGSAAQMNLVSYASLLQDRGMDRALRQIRSVSGQSLELVAEAIGGEGLRSALAVSPNSRRKRLRSSKRK